jgi:hypothetical protein
LDNRGHNLARTMKAMAIACCLVVGALPLGQIPNFVGRCGQKLCHCPMEEARRNESQSLKSAEPKQVFTLTQTSIAGAETTIALQGAFSAFVAPAQLPAPVPQSTREIILDIQYSTARPPGVVAEITTPPPRLTA